MADTSDKLAEDVSALTLNSSNAEQGSDIYEAKWGFRLPELYKIALKFYKEKNGTALKLTYKDKLRLVAYTKQASHGKYRNDVSPDVGFLDVVGSDRRQAWQALGDMSKESAMEEFVKDLDKLCLSFKPYVDAHRTEKIEQLKKQKEEEERLKREAEEQERRRLEEEAQKQLEMQRKRELEQEMQIRAALNQQTAVQFAQYAQQQYPGNKQQQEELIRQLQEQHYQQYMQQVYQQQYLHQQQQYQQIQAANMASQTPNPPTQNGLTEQQTQGNEQQHLQTQQQQQPQNLQTQQKPEDAQLNGQVAPLDNPTNPSNGELEGQIPAPVPLLMPASIWTRKDIQAFKDSVKHCKENVIKLASLATATVRVPTHEDGTCLFWEFATDYYDIGFGVYFEWTIAPNSTVSVHISESSDEEDFEEDIDGKVSDSKGDVEKGSKKDDRPPTDEIIPVYRRDCHEEVYCGSHAYPGQGVYLLKFDNSYSLLRSKTLYYRVYYSR